MKNKKFTSGIILPVLGIVLIILAGCNANKTPMGSDKACTQDAKQCHDGGYVGRIGPNCEFAACSDLQIKEETTATLNQKILNGGIYITPLEVLEDSRCPPDVNCVWAGQVTLKVRLEKEKVIKELTLWQGTPITF